MMIHGWWKYTSRNKNNLDKIFGFLFYVFMALNAKGKGPKGTQMKLVRPSVSQPDENSYF